MKIKNIYLSVDLFGDITVYQHNKVLGITTSIRDSFIPLDSRDSYIITNTINSIIDSIVDNYESLEFLTSKISEYRLYLDATKYKQSIKTNLTFYIIYREALKEYDALIKDAKKKIN